MKTQAIRVFVFPFTSCLHYLKKKNYFFWLHLFASGVLVPQSGIKPALKAQSLNCWTAREAPPPVWYFY